MAAICSITITEDLVHALATRARHATPRETCAVLTGEVSEASGVLTLRALRPVANLARDRSFFVVRKDDVAPLAANEVFFHSHTHRDTTPSMHDRRCSKALGGAILIGRWTRSHKEFSGYHYDYGILPVTH